MFHPRYEVKINASLEKVWNLLSGFDAYPTWNSLLSFKQNPEEGKTIPMKVTLNGKEIVTNIEVLKIKKNSELRWVGGIKGLIRGEHYFILESLDDNTCLLIQGEKFKGLLVPFMWPILKGTLNTLYIQTNEDIAKKCEEGVNS